MGEQKADNVVLASSGVKGGAVEVGMRVLLLDAAPKPPDGGSVGNARPVRAPLRSPTGEEASHTTKTVNDEGTRVSLGRKHAGPLCVVVDSQLDGLLAGGVVANEQFHTCGASDGDTGSVTVFEDDEAGLVVVI